MCFWLKFACVFVCCVCSCLECLCCRFRPMFVCFLFVVIAGLGLCLKGVLSFLCFFWLLLVCVSLVCCYVFACLSVFACVRCWLGLEQI